jgi:hypothetical protein
MLSNKPIERHPVELFLSLPERLIRISAASLGGLVNQVFLLLLPEWICRTHLYQATIERLLRIIIELLGGVQGAFPAGTMSARELATRKAAGNVVELVSFAAVGWSPVWLLAAAADVMDGTQIYLHRLVQDLHQEGVLDSQIQIDSVETLLNVLEEALGQAADTVDMPPLNVEDMRKSWTKFKKTTVSLPSAITLQRIYDDLNAVAHQEGQSVYRTSSLIAQGAVRTGIEMGNLHIFKYYLSSLDAIISEGLSHYIERVSRPYLHAVASHLNTDLPTRTELFLRRKCEKKYSRSNK